MQKHAMLTKAWNELGRLLGLDLYPRYHTTFSARLLDLVLGGFGLRNRKGTWSVDVVADVALSLCLAFMLIALPLASLQIGLTRLGGHIAYGVGAFAWLVTAELHGREERVASYRGGPPRVATTAFSWRVFFLFLGVEIVMLYAPRVVGGQLGVRIQAFLWGAAFAAVADLVNACVTILICTFGRGRPLSRA